MGSPAPEFTLSTGGGETVSLKDLRGKSVVLYFYPKDDTPGCTKEACLFRDMMPEFDKKGAAVFGISADSVKSHARFSAKYGLTFPLLSDPDHLVASAYDSWGPKSFMGREYEGVLRNTFLIDGEGKIARVWEKAKPAEHAAEVLAEL